MAATLYRGRTGPHTHLTRPEGGKGRQREPIFGDEGRYTYLRDDLKGWKVRIGTLQPGDSPWLTGDKAPFKAVKWLKCEQEMFQQLFNEPFPGVDLVTRQMEDEFRAKSIARCWSRIYETVKKTKPNCLLWITCSNIQSKDVAHTEMFKQADWLMNEAGDIEGTDAMKKMVGKQTQLITCLAEWNGQDPALVAPAAIKEGVAVYGFTRPIEGYTMPPVEIYLKHSISGFHGDSRNLAVIARVFKGLPLESVLNPGVGIEGLKD